MWLILCDFVNGRRRTWRLVPALAFIAASEIVVLCLPVDEFRQWLFYTLRQVFLLWSWLLVPIATALPATKWRRPACTASSLQLALGTVKAHVHNILKKSGTTTRQELIQLFWEG